MADDPAGVYEIGREKIRGERMFLTPVSKMSVSSVAETMFINDMCDSAFKKAYSSYWPHVPDDKTKILYASAIEQKIIDIKQWAGDKDGYQVYFVIRCPDLKVDKYIKCLLTCSDEKIRVQFGYHQEEDLDYIVANLQAIWLDNKPAFEDNKVLVNFWVNTPQGPRSIPRYIDVNPFEKIKENYSQKTKDVLTKIVEHVPTKTGQIMLFSGDPGTGKTHALRSILWEWRKRAEFNYIIDPMCFFGHDPVYLTSVLFNESGDRPPMVKERADGARSETKWRVFIMEDSEELLTIDAKEKVGQAMSQLFNVTDGMIGQGLNIMFIMTTNAKIEKFHPAISRPGRCAVKHDFSKLNHDESIKWMVDHGINPSPDIATDHTIAELYDMLEKQVLHTDDPKKKTIGFVGAKE
jgi:hypothetical protein